MTMTVMPNADGTYTVRCNGVEVIVGNKPAEAKGEDVDFGDVEEPGAIIWPEDPEPNDGGVYAYVVAGQAFDNAIALRSPDELLALVEEAVNRAGPSNAVRRLRVFVNPEPEAALDVEALLEPLRDLAERHGLRIEVVLSAAILRGADAR